MAMRRVGYLIQLAFFLRIPLLAAGGLLALAVLAGSSQTTITNMMIMGSCFQLAITTFLAVSLAAHAGLLAALIWNQGSARFRTDLPPIPEPLASSSSLRGLIFLPLALPLIIRLWWRNASDPADSHLGWLDSSMATISGLAAFVLMLWAIEEGRKKLLAFWAKSRQLKERFEGAFFVRATEAFARWMGPGFYQLPATSGDRGHIAPGHAGATLLISVFGAVYVAFYGILDPSRGDPTLAPTLAYILGLLLLLASVFSFATFLLDRWRLPLLMGMVGYLILVSQIFPKDHFFVVRRDAEPSPSPREAVERRRAVQTEGWPEGRRPYLTLVVSSGGGIQAAAWTAQVLTGLQRDEGLGEDFARSIYLLSGVSGGSVGTMYYLEAIDRRLGAPPEDRLEAIFEASSATSLEATAWGLIYPDFLRIFLPFFIDERRDRAWALEQAWMAEAHKLAPGRPGRGIRGTTSPLARESRMLSDWRRGAGEGWLPAVVLNATVVQDGQQSWLSSVDLSGSVGSRQTGASQALEERFGTAAEGDQATIDLSVVTAARLSATFPYVTPLARAVDEDGSSAGLPAIHLADGGYFDNFGVVAALEWLYLLCPTEAPECPLLESFEGILLVEISAFAGPGESFRCREDDGCEAAGNGWKRAFTGPVETILNVRTSSQQSRNELELALLRRWRGEGSVKRFLFRPPDRIDGRRPPSGDDVCDGLPNRAAPVSWHLSKTDIESIRCDWKSEANQGEVRALRGAFNERRRPAP